MRAQSRSFRSLFTIGCIAVLAAGCSSPTDDVGDTPVEVEPGETPTADSAAPQPDQGGESVFMIGDTTYSAELEFCAMRAEQEALFHGPVYDESGAAVGYLNGDFAIDGGDALGEARIDFGVNQKLQSSDEFVAIGEAVGSMVFTGFSDTEWFVIGTAWDQDGTEIPSAKLSVTC